jgi:endonuclease-3
MSARPTPTRLDAILARLEAHHGRPSKPPARTAFEQVLWDVSCYLVPDERRAEVLERLRREVGTRPKDVLAASRSALLRAVEPGGMQPAMRAERVRAAALLADELGDLDAAARKPLVEAVKTFARFPSIGKPGAEKLLLFAGAHAVPALESNGLRVLERLGYAKPARSYAATYRSVRASLASEGERDVAHWTRAHLLLRRHGQEICRRTSPACAACPVRTECPWPGAVTTRRERPSSGGSGPRT